MTRLRQAFSAFQRQYPAVRTSLRARVALGIALPVFVILLMLSGLYYWREIQHLDEYARLAAIQLGDALESSIAHAFETGDDEHLLTILADVSQMENVREIQIVNSDGTVLKSDEHGIARYMALDQNAPECWVCHQYPPEARPRTIDLKSSEYTFRVSTPIIIPLDCPDCSEEDAHHMGVLMIDISLEELRQTLLNHLGLSLGLVFVLTGLFAIGVYALVSHLVVRRIEAFREPIAAYAAGEYSTRIIKDSQMADEICQLADTFNQMAEDIEDYTRAQDERSKLRQRAIVEERERIARELHDGIAQVLGYVNTKAVAVRLMLQQGKIGAAEQHLLQLEEAARGVSVDVRDAILGLRVAGGVDADLPAALREYVARFNLLSDLPVQLELVANCEGVLHPEVVLHLLRIVQEALSNIRKHAHAESVWVILDCQPEQILLEIRDDGCGFEVQKQMDSQQFGLATMQERAKSIQAVLTVVSAPGEGARILLQMPRPKNGT